MAEHIDPDKIIDLGKSSDEEFNIGSEDKNKVFFPTLNLDMGVIPGEMGSKMFLKVMVKKVSADLSNDDERFEIQNMRVLGSADDNVVEDKMTIDKALEIVEEKKITIKSVEE